MGFLQRGLLIYLTIAIAVCMTMPSVIFDNPNNAAERSVLSFFNLELNSTTGLVQTSSTTTSDTIASGTDGFTKPSSPSSSGSLLGFIDPVFQVFEWIGLFFKVLFSPIILLISPAAAGSAVLSNALLMIIGIPLVFMMIVGLVIWIRSGFS
jgi:hypothetical protein